MRSRSTGAGIASVTGASAAMVAASGVQPAASGRVQERALRASVSIRICRLRAASPNMMSASGFVAFDQFREFAVHSLVADVEDVREPADVGARMHGGAQAR